MEKDKRDEASENKKKYVKPELISLDKENEAQGGFPSCATGSAASGVCTAGASAV